MTKNAKTPETENPTQIVHSSIAVAIAAAAGEIDPVERDTTGQAGHRQFSYASLAQAVRTIRPILAKHGLGVVQPPLQRVIDGQLYAGCRTILVHSSGDHVEQEWLLPVGQKEKNPMMNIGAAVSYARRYSYPFFVADDENDAPENPQNQGRQAAPSGPSQGQRGNPASAISEKQVKRLQAKLGDASDRDKALAQVILERAKAATGFPQDSSITVMPKGIYDAFCQFIDDWPQSAGDDVPAPEDESQDPADQRGVFPDDVPVDDDLDRQFEEGLDR